MRSILTTNQVFLANELVSVLGREIRDLGQDRDLGRSLVKIRLAMALNKVIFMAKTIIDVRVSDKLNAISLKAFHCMAAISLFSNFYCTSASKFKTMVEVFALFKREQLCCRASTSLYFLLVLVLLLLLLSRFLKKCQNWSIKTKIDLHRPKWIYIDQNGST